MNYEIYLDGELINTIWASEDFVKQYCAENRYTYKLRQAPEPMKMEPTAQDDTDALLVEQEYRLTLLELGVNE